jgi:hypothetical protein
MADHHHGSPGGPQGAQGGPQRFFPLGVQAGVGLVQHQQARAAVHRAGQPDALALAAGQPRAAGTEPRVVALRQAQDHVVGVRPARGGDDLFGVGLVQAGDVFRHRPGEQLHVLRQIADVAPQPLARPLPEFRAVQANLAAARPPAPGDQARQGGFSATARSDDAERLARFERERHPLQQRPVDPRAPRSTACRPTEPLAVRVTRWRERLAGRPARHPTDGRRRELRPALSSRRWRFPPAPAPAPAAACWPA